MMKGSGCDSARMFFFLFPFAIEKLEAVFSLIKINQLINEQTYQLGFEDDHVASFHFIMSFPISLSYQEQ